LTCHWEHEWRLGGFESRETGTPYIGHWRLATKAANPSHRSGCMFEQHDVIRVGYEFHGFSYTTTGKVGH
jgi:hypothetical protein